MAKFVLATVAALLCVQTLVVSGASLPARSESEVIVDFLETQLHNLLGQDAADKSDVQTRGFKNPLSCMTYFPEFYNIIKEVKEVIDIFRSNSANFDAEKEKCKLKPTAAEILSCEKKVDIDAEAANDVALQQAYAIIPKTVNIMRQFKKCLWE